MKRTILYLSLLGMAVPAAMVRAEDMRQLVRFPPAAEENLRIEMRDNLRALNEIQSLLAENKLTAAAEVAEKELGRSAMGKHRNQPLEARPGPHMPPAMHQIGREGHQSASEFARIAASGDRDKAIAALPMLTTGCVGCHFSYRIR